MKRLVVGAIIAVCLYLAARGVVWDDFLAAMRTVRLGYIVAAVPLLLGSYLLRTVRWYYLFPASIRQRRLRSLFPTLMIGFFANNFLPARSGEFARAMLMGRHNGISRAGVLATVVAERAFDGLLLCVIGLLAVKQFAAGELAWLSRAALILGGIFLAVIGLAWQRRACTALLAWCSAKFPGHFPALVIQKLRRMLDFLEDMSTVTGLCRIVLLTLAVWSCEFGVYMLVGLGFGVWLSLPQAGIMMASINFASLMPAAPGGIGTIEFVGTEAMVFTGLSREIALALVVTQHTLQYLFCLGLGLYFTRRLAFSWRGMPVSWQRPLLDIDDLIAGQAQHYGDAVRQYHAVVPEDAVRISMVIPAYNEEKRILPTLLSIQEYLQGRGYTFEVIVVDDGSQDDTARLVRELGRRFTTIKLIRLPRNMGKGAAVRTGMRNATGHFLMYNDADGATSILEIERLLAAMDRGADVAIGSRALYSTETHVERKLSRAVSGRVFAFLVNMLVVPGIADTQCGFKMFRRPVAQRIFELQQLDGFAFDVEVLRLASVLGYDIVEVPVNWTDMQGSKVSVLRDAWRMLRDMLLVRYLVPNSLAAARQSVHDVSTRSA